MSVSLATGTAARRAGLVEIVGPAGAGKSALAAILPRCDRRIGRGPGLWGQPRRALLAAGCVVAPGVIGSMLVGRGMDRGELAQMVRVEALCRRLRPDASSRAVAPRWLVMDEGPVFGLAWLEVFCGGHREGRRHWREESLRRWATRLDAVVYVDAPDEVLAQRIRQRAKPHMIKRASDDAMAAFAERFRTAFRRVLSDLVRSGPVRVIDCPSTGASSADMAAGLLPQLVGRR